MCIRDRIKRALNSERGTQFFEVIEEILDTQIAHGLSENEFFNNYVDSKNMKDGDVNEFWADDEVILTVSKVSGDSHDLSLQRLGSGQSYHVDTAVYGIKAVSYTHLIKWICLLMNMKMN